MKNGKQRITQITCHCLFSLKKRQSVGFSGVPLFFLLFVPFLFLSRPSLRSPVDPERRSKPSSRRNVNISGEPSGCVSRHLRDTEPGPTPRNYPISGGSLRARRRQPGPPVTAQNSFIPTQSTRATEKIFLIRDENKWI